MRCAWAFAALAVMAGCAGHPPAAEPARTAIGATPTPLDYVVFASMADATLPVALATFGVGNPPAASEVAVQLQ